MARHGYRRTVLDIDHALLRGVEEEGDGGRQMRADFALYGGELALVRPNDLQMGASLADAFSGLLHPLQGSVRFLNRDWRDVSTDAANAMRGKIGRVFTSGSWLDSLSLSDNILLPQRHHTRRPNEELLQEAAYLAQQFGLPGLPRGYPGSCSRGDLQRAACVRAFMGRPVLLLLEEPTSGVHHFVLPALINVIRRACDRGGAVWWMTISEEVWTDTTIPADRLFRVSGRELTEVDRRT